MEGWLLGLSVSSRRPCCCVNFPVNSQRSLGHRERLALAAGRFVPSGCRSTKRITPRAALPSCALDVVRRGRSKDARSIKHKNPIGVTPIYIAFSMACRLRDPSAIALVGMRSFSTNVFGFDSARKPERPLSALHARGFFPGLYRSASPRALNKFKQLKNRIAKLIYILLRFTF